IFFSGRGRHTSFSRDWSSDVCSSDLTGEGQIDANYIPAFIRRYPFVFAGDAENKNLTLCVDEDSKALVKDGSTGKRLFDDNGEQIGRAACRERVEVLVRDGP